MRTVDFYLGLGSRYSYLAASQVDRIEKTYGCRFVWKPIASGALMDRRGGNPFRGEPLSGQYDWGYREYDAKCWAAYYGIPFREPVAFRVDPDRLALACLAAGEQDALVPCCRLLQQLIFVEGLVIDSAVIAGLTGRLGLDEAALPTRPCIFGDARQTRRFARRGCQAWCLRRTDFFSREPDVLGKRPPGVVGGGIGGKSLAGRFCICHEPCRPADCRPREGFDDVSQR